MRLQQGRWDACAPTNAGAFVPSKGPSTKVTIGSPDDVEVTLDTLNKCSPQPPTIPVPPASPIVTSRRTTPIRIENEEAGRWHEEAKCWREEATGEAPPRRGPAKEEERKKEHEAKCEKKAEESRSNLTSEERFALSPDPRSTSVGGATLQSNRSPMVYMPSQGGMSSVRKAQPDVDTPEMVDRKVKALLNKLTMERFDSISEQIIQWANKSVNEEDGRTLIQVIRLVLEKATYEAAWSEMYARLCRKMMEQISPNVQDDGIKNPEGKSITGGQLFLKHLLNRCQEDFDLGWFAKEDTAASAKAKASDDQATKDANEKKGTEEAELYLNEYYAAQKARRLGLMKFIGELFKLQMLTERIMHECVKMLLGNVENRGEEEIENLCQLLKTVGQLLDTPKARAHMDVYFTRMKELGKSINVSSRMQFMLQDVIELRERKWVRNAVAAPTVIAAAHEVAANEKAAAEKQYYNRQASMSRGGTTSNTATSTASTSKPTINKADIAKLFRNPSSSSSQLSSDTSSPSTRPHNLLPHHQPSSSTSQQLPQPSQLVVHPYAHFVPGMRQTQQSTGAPRFPAFTRAVANMPAQSRPGGPGGPGGLPMPASPRMAPHPHQAPHTGVAPRVAMQPIKWCGYYYPMGPYNQPQHSWYYPMTSRYMHQQPHQHGPHTAPPHPRQASPQLPGTPTMAHAIPHPLHTPPPPPSVSSPHSPKPTVKIPAASPFVTSRRTTSIQIESEEQRRWREKNAEEERIRKEDEDVEDEHLRREEEEHLEVQQNAAKRDPSAPPPSPLPAIRVIENFSEVVYCNTSGAVPHSAAGLGIGYFQKPSVLGPFQTGNLQSTGSEPTIEEHLLPSPGGKRNKRTRAKRGNSNKALLSHQGQGSAFESSIPTYCSEKVDDDVKEFFAVRNLEEADVYFADLPHEHRFRLVDKLVASALERKEADAKLVGELFARVESNGLCTLAVFEEGFMLMAEFLDDIAIDAPMAFDNMAIMLSGAGFEKEPERLERIAPKLADSNKLDHLAA